MNRSTFPTGLLGVTSLASTFHVRSPHVRYRNGPNASSRLTLWALSVGSSGSGLLSLANGFFSPVLGSTWALAVIVFSSMGVLAAVSGILSPTLSVLDL